MAAEEEPSRLFAVSGLLSSYSRIGLGPGCINPVCGGLHGTIFMTRCFSRRQPSCHISRKWIHTIFYIGFPPYILTATKLEKMVGQPSQATWLGLGNRTHYQLTAITGIQTNSANRKNPFWLFVSIGISTINSHFGDQNSKQTRFWDQVMQWDGTICYVSV